MLLYSTLQRVKVHNWYLGEILLLNAWQSGATIDKKTDQDKVRRNLKKIGYKAKFSRGILTIVKTTPGYLTLCNS